MRLALVLGTFLAVSATAGSASPTPRPELLKRHGIVYGVRGLGYGGCETYEAGDACTSYKLLGVIVAVFRNPDSHRVEAFTLRTPPGHKEMQNIDADNFPAAALSLIRRGRHVRVSGVRTGNGQVTTPDEIVVVQGRR